MAAASGPMYWCHQCNRQTRPQPGEEVVCTYCNGGFVEEMQNTEVAPGMEFSSLPLPLASLFGLPFPVLGEIGSRASPRGRDDEDGDVQRHRPRLIRSHHPGFSQLLGSMTNVMQRDTNPGGVEVPGGRVLIFQGEAPNFFGSLGNLEVFVDRGVGAGPQLLPGHFGDFFLGPELDRLIQLLAENDPNRYGPPPASKAAVEAMPTVEITEEHLRTEVLQCAVCKDDFAVGTTVKQMPCKHMYHPDCILPWLSQHNTCPVCRYEMPTDNVEDGSRAPSPPMASRSVGDGNNPANIETEQAGRNSRQDRLSRQFTLVGMPGLGIDSNSNQASSSNEESTETSSPASGQDTSEARSGTGGAGIRLPIPIPWLFRLFSSPTSSSVETNSGNETERASNASGTPTENANQQPSETNSGNETERATNASGTPTENANQRPSETAGDLSAIKSEELD